MRLWFQETAVFLVFGFVSAQLQGFQTCAFAKTSPKTKNPRCPSLFLFCQGSNKPHLEILDFRQPFPLQ